MGMFKCLSSLKNHCFNTDKQVRYMKEVRKMKKNRIRLKKKSAINISVENDGSDIIICVLEGKKNKH